MVLVNYAGKEINAKLVYYGPGLSGKTTNLEYIYTSVPATHRGKMVSMKTKTERTLFFDFLPLDLGDLGGYRTRFLLYTVPGQVYYNATRKLVLKGVDAVVFVADSKRAKMDENKESLENLRENLREMGLELNQIPWVLQYNKRDLPDAASVEELNRALNPEGVPVVLATASHGEGVFDTFKEVSKLLLKSLSKNLGPSVLSRPAARPDASTRAAGAARAPAAPAPAMPHAPSAAMPHTPAMPTPATAHAPSVPAMPRPFDASAMRTEESAPPRRAEPAPDAGAIRASAPAIEPMQIEHTPSSEPAPRAVEAPPRPVLVKVEPEAIPATDAWNAGTSVTREERVDEPHETPFIVSDPPRSTDDRPFAPTIDPAVPEPVASLAEAVSEAMPDQPIVPTPLEPPVASREVARAQNGKTKNGIFGWLRRSKQETQPEEATSELPVEQSVAEDSSSAFETVCASPAEAPAPEEAPAPRSDEPQAVVVSGVTIEGSAAPAEPSPPASDSAKLDDQAATFRASLRLVRAHETEPAAEHEVVQAPEVIVPVVLPEGCREVRLVLRLVMREAASDGAGDEENEESLAVERREARSFEG